MVTPTQIAAEIKRLAIEAGFARVGITDLSPTKDAWRYERWIERGLYADMHYLKRNMHLRRDPACLVDDAKSVVCLAWAHGRRESQSQLLARYARVRDYHRVLKQRCRSIIDNMRQSVPNFAARAFVDSAPVLERSLAARAGLGWIGKNSCLIVPRIGSYVLLAEIFCNIELPHDSPLEPGCGDCNACLDACPGGAIGDDGFIDARRCLSYLTIEHERTIDARMRRGIDRRIIGCDACQEACPHNEHCQVDADVPDHPLSKVSLEEILAWSYEDWDRVTAGNAARRAGYKNLLRNAVILAANTRRVDLSQRIQGLGNIVGQELVGWAMEALR